MSDARSGLAYGVVRPGSRPETRHFVIQPGDVFEETFDDLQQGLRIDNLSSQWLLVAAPLRRFIPPYTLGWQASLQPATRLIRITPASAPVGLSSGTVQGTTVNIEVTTLPMLDDEGRGYGDVQPIATEYNLTQIFTLNTGGVANTDVGHSVIPNITTSRLRLHWASITTGFGNTNRMRTIFIGDITSNLFILGIADEQPADHIVLPVGGIALLSGEGLTVITRSEGANNLITVIVGITFEAA